MRMRPKADAQTICAQSMVRSAAKYRTPRSRYQSELVAMLPESATARTTMYPTAYSYTMGKWNVPTADAMLHSLMRGTTARTKVVFGFARIAFNPSATITNHQTRNNAATTNRT